MILRGSFALCGAQDDSWREGAGLSRRPFAVRRYGAGTGVRIMYMNILPVLPETTMYPFPMPSTEQALPGEPGCSYCRKT